MLTAIEYGKRGIVGIGEAADSFGRLQIIRAAAQNCRRNIPLDGVFTDIAKIIPRQILAKPRLDYPLRLEPLLGDICPCHHVGYEPLHVHNGRNEKCPVCVPVNAGVHAKICADAVGDQNYMGILRLQLGEKRRKLVCGVPRSIRLVIKTANLGIGKQSAVMLRLGGIAALATDI